MQAVCGQQAGAGHPHCLAGTQAGLGRLTRVWLLVTLSPGALQYPLPARDPEDLGPVVGLRGSGASPGRCGPLPAAGCAPAQGPGAWGRLAWQRTGLPKLRSLLLPLLPTGARRDGPARQQPLQTRPRPHD